MRKYLSSNNIFIKEAGNLVTDKLLIPKIPEVL